MRNIERIWRSSNWRTVGLRDDADKDQNCQRRQDGFWDEERSKLMTDSSEFLISLALFYECITSLDPKPLIAIE